MYKEVFPLSGFLSVWPPNKRTGAREDMINTPVRPRYQEHPSPLSICILEQHRCHFWVKMNGWIFRGLNEDTMATGQRQRTKLHPGKLHPDKQSHQAGRLFRIVLISSVFYLTRKFRKYWHIPFKAAFISIEQFHFAVGNYISLCGYIFNLKIDLKIKYIYLQIFVFRIESPDSDRTSAGNKLFRSEQGKVLT